MEGTRGSVEWCQGQPEACTVSFQPPLVSPPWLDGMRREGFRSCSPYPTVLLCPSPPSEMDSRAVRLRGCQERLRVWSLMEGCPSLSCQGGGEGKLAVGVGGWVGKGASPLNCPDPILCGPRRQRLKCHCLGPGKGDGEVSQHPPL